MRGPLERAGGVKRAAVVVAAAVLGLVWHQAQVAGQSATEHALADSPAGAPLPRERAYMPEREHREWAVGGGTGLIVDTPDGSGLALNGYADYRVDERVSVGPLLQLGLTDDMVQTGLSGQGKYRIPLPGASGRGHIVVQSGVGFVHADAGPADTSWLVPVGAGIEYEVSPNVSLESNVLVNFTDLNVGGSDTNLMPSLMFGLRF